MEELLWVMGQGLKYWEPITWTDGEEEELEELLWVMGQGLKYGEPITWKDGEEEKLF